MKRILANIFILIIGICIGLAAAPLGLLPADTVSSAQGNCRTFPETGKQVCGRFLDYWTKNGGLAQQGLPLSGEFTEVNDLDGKSYVVQYFERAVFEKHPENAAPYDVLLSQLGTFQFKRKYPGGDPGGSAPPPPQPGGLIGQKLEVSDLSGRARLTLEVLDAKESKTIPATGLWKEATAKGKFVAIKVKVTNLGNESAFLSTYHVRLKDSKNRFFDTTSDINAILVAAEYYGGEPPATQIQPSFSETLILLYDIAEDSTGYVLVKR